MHRIHSLAYLTYHSLIIFNIYEYNGGPTLSFRAALIVNDFQFCENLCTQHASIHVVSSDWSWMVKSFQILHWEFREVPTYYELLNYYKHEQYELLSKSRELRSSSNINHHNLCRLPACPSAANKIDRQKYKDDDKDKKMGLRFNKTFFFPRYVKKIDLKRFFSRAYRLPISEAKIDKNRYHCRSRKTREPRDVKLMVIDSYY